MGSGRITYQPPGPGSPGRTYIVARLDRYMAKSTAKRSRRFSYPRVRRRVSHRATYGLVTATGGAVSAIGAAVLPYGGSTDLKDSFLGQLATGNLANATYGIVNSINPLSSDPATAANRSAVWGGIGIYVLGRVLRAAAPGLHRHGIKLGRHMAIAPL